RLDLKPGMSGQEVRGALRRGMTVRGQVLGPVNAPVPDTWMISRIILEPTPGIWKTWRADYHGRARDGRFEIHGLDPDTETPVYFFEPNRKLGATAVFSGKSDGGPIIVRLEPCGTARARLVDPEGKPVAGWRIGPYFTTMVVTPGPLRYASTTSALL